MSRLGPFSALVLALWLPAGAEILDRPSGIRIGERMTLRPSVSAAITYDSGDNFGQTENDIASG